MILGSTRAVVNKAIRDIQCAVFWVSLVVQIVFMGYYGWSIYANMHNLPFLIIYAVLAAISLTAFITFLITNKHKKMKNKKFNRFLRVFKYIVNGATLAFNTYDLLQSTPTDLEIILFALSAIVWLANIVLEIIRASVERYWELFTVALESDFAFMKKLQKAAEVKGNFFEFIDAPLEAVANLLEKKKTKAKPAPTQAEVAVAEIAKEFKAEKKAEIQENSAKRAKKEKKEIKDHLKVIAGIFRLKKKK